MSDDAVATLPPPLHERRGAIVLVHGAWVGEWSWLPVEPALRVSGRPVHTVSLAGHGARSHESGPHVDLDVHVRDVIGVIETLDLVDVTLVGHSYGGRVITRVVEQMPERVSSLVYLDAHTPVAEDSGQSPERTAEAERHGGMLPFPSFYEPAPEIVGGPGGLDWFNSRLMPQSFACLTGDWIRDLPADVSKVFVFASGYEPSRFTQYAEFCEQDAAWEYHDLPGDHFLMFSHPADVARIILSA